MERLTPGLSPTSAEGRLLGYDPHSRQLCMDVPSGHECVMLQRGVGRIAHRLTQRRRSALRCRSAITALAASQHGDVLATGDLNGGVRVWQLLQDEQRHSSMRLHRVWEAHSDRVASLQWAEPPSLAEIFLLSAGDDGRVALWTPNGACEGRFGESKWALTDGVQSPPVSVRAPVGRRITYTHTHTHACDGALC